MGAPKPDNPIDATIEAGIVIAAAILYVVMPHDRSREECVSLARQMAQDHREMHIRAMSGPRA